MSGPSDCRFDLNFGEEVAMPSQDNIWHLSFLSPTGLLTIGNYVMKNDMTVAVVPRNLLIPKDNRLLSKRSDELAVLWLSVFSVLAHDYATNMKRKLDQLQESDSQILLDHQRLAHDYATNMKRKLDQLQESDGQILLDHQRFVGLFQRHLLPSSSGAVSRNEGPNDQPLVPPPSGVLPSTEAPNNHHLVPHLTGALPTAETSPEQPL
ncbi:unnamed protein product [Malus baccata var. baccata]